MHWADEMIFYLTAMDDAETPKDKLRFSYAAEAFRKLWEEDSALYLECMRGEQDTKKHKVIP
jgi:hypothetical protein